MQTASAQVDTTLQRRSEDAHDDRLAEKCSVLQEERDLFQMRRRARRSLVPDRRGMNNGIGHNRNRLCKCIRRRCKQGPWCNRIQRHMLPHQIAALQVSIHGSQSGSAVCRSMLRI